MAPRIAILISLFLAACGQDVRDLRLDEVDLANQVVAQKIGRQLGPADSRDFTTYAAIHAHSGGLCGNRLRDGKLPGTVGDAIEAMRWRTEAGEPRRAAS